MLEIGSFVFDKRKGTSVQVLEKLELWGYTSYKVFSPATGQVYKANEEQLNISGEEVYYDENYLRYVSFLAKIKNETAGGLLTSLSSGVIPLPHQLHALKRALETNNIRYILADEVGLGKTIEAGMIIKELKARGLVKRVLVVCPTGLVTQWSAELQEKFHEKFQVILPSDYDTIRRLTDNEDVYGQYDQVISPMDAIKPIEKHAGWSEEKVEKYNEERIYSIINSGWDLVIIDEAHRVAGSTGEVARYKLGKLLSEASPYLLLLTGTPHNGKTDPFLRLVRLLDADAFPNTQSIVKEQVAPYLIRTEKREAIDSNGNRLFKDRVTHLITLQWDEKHSLQRQLYEMVSNYVSKTYGKAVKNKKKNMCLIFLLIIMQRMATSSTAALKDSLQRRLYALVNQSTKLGDLKESDLEDLNIEDGVEDAFEALSLDINTEIDEIEDMMSTAKQAEFQHPDVKVEKLTDLIDAILTENKEQKIIVFTEFVGTQRYLVQLLRNKGYSVNFLNGSMGIEERNEALEEFRNKTNIFVATDAGGEGLNLQFSNIIINYDLPWNPMKLEQRCGRVDRIGQQKDVHIYNFIVSDTIENRVREVLEDKLAVILQEMGVDKYSDVLDSEVAEYDFTEVYMKTIEKPYNVEKNMHSVESEMKQQMENARKYKDIIHEEKDLSGLVGEASDFEVDKALKLMLTFHEHWQGREVKLIDRISVADEQIAKLLRASFKQDLSSQLLLVGIENFPNEEGYFMLWELTIANDSEATRIIPIFVNKDFILRPMAGKKILEVFLDPTSRLTVSQSPVIDTESFERLKGLSCDFSYDTFVNLRDKHLEQVKETYDKYMYAIKLRLEAAEHIGIENIKKARVKSLKAERNTIETEYRNGKQIFPEFCLMALFRLEA